MYRKPPDPAELAAIGLTLADFDRDNTVELLPDCVPAFEVFDVCGTQWRMGPNGPCGLDYAAVKPACRMAGIRIDDWPAVFADLRTLESEALRTMYEGRKNG
jgi:hypothetical protein